MQVYFCCDWLGPTRLCRNVSMVVLSRLDFRVGDGGRIDMCRKSVDAG